MLQTEETKGESPFFPFALDDLQYWVVKRKDGMIVKYRVVGPSAPGEKNTTIEPPHHYPPNVLTANYTSSPSLSGWCKHNPADEPVWIGEKVDLYIADATGCRVYNEDFDFVLDCGDILSASRVNPSSSPLVGDDKLVRGLDKFTTPTGKPTPRFLQIDWDDRAAPPLKFEFWPALLKMMSGTCLATCQGGHGRSGTSLVCMMMVLNPEYSPADAMIHLRAVHCPRAIEGLSQHNYINEFGKFLGREPDIDRVKGIKDFKAEFLKFTLPSAQPYQDRLINPKVKK